MSLKEMSVGDRMVLIGHLMATVAGTMITVGGILRTKELPDKPFFTPANEGQHEGGKPDVNHPSYWERGHL